MCILHVLQDPFLRNYLGTGRMQRSFNLSKNPAQKQDNRKLTTNKSSVELHNREQSHPEASAD